MSLFKRIILLGSGAILVALFIVPKLGRAFVLDHDFPRVAAFQLNPNGTSAKELARYDLVILEMNTTRNNPSLIPDIRRYNPSTIVLAYTSPVEYPKYRLNEVEPSGHGLWHDLGAGIKTEWGMKTVNGKEVSFWPKHVSMNLSAKDASGQTYANYLGNFLYDSVLAGSAWDGLLFDTSWNTISWHDENIDIDGDGKKDEKSEIDAQWKKGFEELLQTLRRRGGNKYLLITNGDVQVSQQNNGRMFESFPEFWEGGWNGSMNLYIDTENNGYAPRLNIINSDTDNSGNFSNAKPMRFGLTSALLSNGYFNFDYGTMDRSFTTYYDEYAVSLGKPVAGGYNLLDSKNLKLVGGLWRRDFEKGISLVNSSAQARTYSLPAEYEKIHGTLDTFVNSGQVVSKVTIAPSDGIILLRPLENLVNSPFLNGSYIRLYKATGKQTRTGFFLYDERFDGSQMLMKADLDADGFLETVAATASEIIVYANNGQVKTRFFPYGSAYRAGVQFSLGDLGGDKRLEIVTGTMPGGAAQVRVFNHLGKAADEGFFAFSKDTKGGVTVAIGDINGDGKKEIIAGAGKGQSPQVRVFDAKGKEIQSGFLAYKSSFLGGINVAVGDTNGDGKDDIITGAGSGGGPHVRIFDAKGKSLGEFFAFSARSNAGVRVWTQDVDSDKRFEVVAMTTDFGAL